MPFHAGGEENSATVELYSKWAKATFDEYEMNNRNAARSAFLPTDKSVVEMVEVNSYSSETESPTGLQSHPILKLLMTPTGLANTAARPNSLLP